MRLVGAPVSGQPVVSKPLVLEPPVSGQQVWVPREASLRAYQQTALSPTSSVFLPQVLVSILRKLIPRLEVLLRVAHPVLLVQRLSA